MPAEKFVYLGIILATLVGFVTASLIFQGLQEEPQVIDYSNRFDGITDRFDRIEAGIINSTIDFCFRWGGQWITDANGISISDFEIPVGNGLFSKGQAIYCVKQKPQA